MQGNLLKYLPILDELFTSDSVIFLVIGLVVSAVIGLKMKAVRKNLLALSVCFVLYAVCEVVSNVHTSYLAEIILLIAGTVSIGGMMGFLLGLAAAAWRKRR